MSVTLAIKMQAMLTLFPQIKVDHALVFGIEVISVGAYHIRVKGSWCPRASSWHNPVICPIARENRGRKRLQPNTSTPFKKVSFCFKKENEMITAKLVNGQSLKSCKLCDTYATTDITEMLQHLSEHNKEEIEAIKANFKPNVRYKGLN